MKERTKERTKERMKERMEERMKADCMRVRVIYIM